jgi:catechol 2,3-dioxygenase-like lactoylglutathione lyase family enzyme
MTTSDSHSVDIPRISGVLETSLYARDLRATAAFYEKTLGLRPLLSTPRLTAFDAGAGSVLLIFQQGATERDTRDERGLVPGHSGSGQLHFALAIAAADLQAWRARLVQEGVSITGEYVWSRGGTSLYFHDPDGAVVELATPGLWETR